MASPGLSEIATTTIEHRSRELRNNFLRNNALIARLNARGRVRTFPGGRTIVEELSYANNQTFQWYSGYQTLNIAPSDTMTAAEFAIRQAALAVSISGLEELQNSGSRESMIDLLASRIENAEDTFLNGLSLAMYGDGSVSGTIGGLQALVADSPSTGTVGGISRDTWAFWRNIAYDASSDGGAAATSANIIQYMTALWKQLVRGRDKPDLIVADGNYWELYHNALVAIQRIATDNTAPDLAGAGYRSLKFMDADVVLDGGYQGVSSDPFTAMYSGGTAVGGVPSNHMYFLNTRYIHWRPHAERNMVPLKPDRFSVNQDAMVRLMGWAGNMTLSAAFLQGVLKA